jgi:uncharacterized iron-regulated membrane protein
LKRFFNIARTLHAYSGVTIALLMLLISTTGSLLVWKQEYLEWVFPQARVQFTPTPEALAKIATAVEAQFPADDLTLIEFGTAVFPLTKVTMVDNRYAYLDAQGKIVTQWTLNDRPEEWLFDLHHRLLLGNLGLTIVGCTGMAMLILVLAGVTAFWPMRRGFRQGWWPPTTTRRHLQGSHRNIGIVMALPLFMSAVTGITLAFPEPTQKLLLEPFRGPHYSEDFAEHLDGISGGHSGDWLPAMQRALQTFPGAQIRSAQTPNTFSPYRIIGVQQPGEWNPLGMSKVNIEAQGGFMDIRMDSQAQHVSERIYNAGYPLHTGRMDSLVYKLLLSLCGLLIATLSMLGLVSFTKRFWKQ